MSSVINNFVRLISSSNQSFYITGTGLQDTKTVRAVWKEGNTEVGTPHEVEASTVAANGTSVFVLDLRPLEPTDVDELEVCVKKLDGNNTVNIACLDKDKGDI